MSLIKKDLSNKHNLNNNKLLSNNFNLLKHYSIVTVTGKDSFNFLQEQFTNNLLLLNNNNYIFCAHCNPYGKTISNFILFKYKDGFGYLINNDIKKNQIQLLKKYSIFSKIEINENNKYVILSIIGNKLSKNLFSKIKIKNKFLYISYNEKKDIFYNKLENSFIILKNKYFAELKKKLIKYFDYVDNHKYFYAFNICSGIPIIHQPNIEIFLPQSINLKTLSAISFNKGCYSGQESITKIEFRKSNKKNLCWLIGNYKEYPIIGDYLEIQINKIWYDQGIILSFVTFQNSEIWIQAVFNKKILLESNKIRIKKDNENYLYLKKIFK